MKPVSVGIGCLVFAFAGTLNAQSPRVDSTACVGHWSAPFPVHRADGRPVYVERGLIASFAHQTLALGAPTIFWLARDHIVPTEAITDTAALVWSLSRAGALIDSTGTAVGVPLIDSLHPRETPRLVRQDGRTVVVAWATADSASRVPGAADNRIELASFDGHRWSTPKAIVTGLHVDLQPLPAVRAGSRVSPSIIAVTVHDSAGYLVRLARADGERWVTSDWRGDIVGMSSAVAAAWTDGSMTVLVMGSRFRSGSGVYSIRGEPSATGYTWSDPEFVDSLRDSYEALSTARLGGDSLVVVWYGPPARGQAGVLNTALSVDRGRSWTLTVPLSARSGIDGVRLAVDGGGILHAIYRGAPEEQAHVINAPGFVMHSAWRSNGWTTPTAVSNEPSRTAPAIGATDGGGLMAMWATAARGPAGPMPRSFASLWRPGCVR
jgi:hypothetical protein